MVSILSPSYSFIDSFSNNKVFIWQNIPYIDLACFLLYSIHHIMLINILLCFSLYQRL